MSSSNSVEIAAGVIRHDWDPPLPAVLMIWDSFLAGFELAEVDLGDAGCLRLADGATLCSPIPDGPDTLKGAVTDGGGAGKTVSACISPQRQLHH